MLRKILVATDFSTTARQTLLFALSFASRISASVSVLHVHKLEIIRGGFSFQKLKTLEEEKKSFYLEKLQEHLGQIQKEYSFAREVQTEVLVDLGSVIDKVIYHSEHYDIVMLGSHGEHKETLVEKLIGSLPVNLIHTLHKPLFIFPKNRKFNEEFSKILFLTASPDSLFPRVSFLKDFIKNLSEKTYLDFYFRTSRKVPENQIKELQAQFAPLLLEKTEICQEESCETRLLQFIRKGNYSLLVLGKKKMHGVLTTYTPTFSDKFYSDLNLPLLILKTS